VIADDNPDDRREMRRLLLTGSDTRYEFVECDSASEVVRLVREASTQAPHCLLLDFFLPDMDAPELLPALQTADGLTACAVVVVTGSADASHGRQMLRLGAQDFIGKAWLSAPGLARAVDNAIERWTMQRELLDSRRALQVRERQLHSLANNIPDILTRFDPQYRYVFANTAMTRYTGRPVEEVLGRTARELGLPADLCNRWDAALGRVFESGTTEEMEYEYDALAGLTWFASRLVPELDTDGRIAQVLCITRDVTQQRLDEAATREIQQRLQLALTAACAGAWSWDISNGALEWSAENYLLYGRSPSLGPPLYDDWLAQLHPDDRARVEVALRDTLSRKVPEFRAEFRVMRPGADARWILEVGRAEFNEGGEAVRMVGISLDIQDRKQIEAALRDEDRRKDEFLATLSHELRNPLAPLTTGLAVLKLAPPGAAVAATALGVMERQLGHLARLVDDLMDVSRIRNGRIELQVAPVSIGDVVRQSIEACQPLIERAQHQVTVVVEPAQIAVEGDEVRLTQILTNVLNNAVKYTGTGGNIVVQAGIEGNMAVLRVVDDGVGIAPALLSQVFELFTQVGRARDRSSGGLGIGLSLVRTLVELHGGTVRCDSRGLGLGTTVEIRVPRLVAIDTGSSNSNGNGNGSDAGTSVLRNIGSVAANAASVPSDAARRVLLIDDNVDGADTMALMLQLSGFEVWTEYDGAAGLAAARKLRPAIMLVDIGLPTIDGYEVARRVRADPGLRTVRLIALTGWGSENDQRLALEAGFDVHCTKPVDLAVLAGLLAAPEPLARADRG